MFALTKREPVSNFSENQNPKRNDAVAKMASKAVLAGSVMLATQLEASEKEEESLSTTDDIQTSSLRVSNVQNHSEVENTPTFAEAKQKPVGSEVTSISNQTTGSINSSSPTNTVSVEAGLPRDFISQSPGVSDPAQVTREIPQEIEGFERAETMVNINSGSANQSPIIVEGIDGEDGRDGLDGKNGIDGIDGRNGHDGIDGTNGTDGIDGRDGVDGSDGKTVLLLNADLLAEYDILDTLAAQGVTITDGPLGTVALAMNSDQLSEVSDFINSLIPEASVDDEFIHGASPVSGSEQEDLLVGTSGDDILSSLGANDVLIGGEGSDTLLGGNGNDTASYFSSNQAVEVNLATNENFGGDAEGDSLNSIENLIGSNFGDLLLGNDQDNNLSGGIGTDLLFGGGSKDFLHGGAGADILDGGTSNDDVATYFDSDAGVSISLADDTASGGHAEGDELDNIEFVNGSLFDDFIQGDNQGNRLGGLFGEDILLGEGGNDVLLGGNSADIINGGDGVDTSDYTASLEGVSVDLSTGESLFGEAEGDTLISIENLAGSAFDDVLTGDDNVNRLTGRDGDDMLFGNGGNDRLVGGLGADKFDGGEGTRDAADYSAATQAVGVDLIAGGFEGEAQGDTFTGIEFIVGSEHHDNLLADDGINRVNGGDGCDVIFGRGGNDTLIGEAGNDILNGGEGNDVFIFNEGDGNDTIEDFEAGIGRTDRLRLSEDAFDDFEDIQSALTDTDDGALLTLDDGSILFQGLNAADFVADDFILG